jgi:uncharacterized protein (TIGR04255 family)
LRLLVDSEKYPNAPVREVVFEIRFPGEPSVESKRDQFFDLVRSEFPEVHVPIIDPARTQAIALVPYHFKSPDRSRAILTALNLVAYSTQNYPGFRQFKDEVSGILEKFWSIVRIEKLTRIGLRYVNAIPLPPGSNPANLLNVGIALGNYPGEAVQNLQVGLEIPRERGLLTMRLGPAPSVNQPVLSLDFDYSKEKDLTFSRVGEYLDESHEETRMLFESLITDSYRSYLRGEAIA